MSQGAPTPEPLQLGDRASVFEPQARKKVWWELVGVWLGTLLLIRGVVTVSELLPGTQIAGLFSISEVILALVPVLFIYAPVWVCRLRGVDSYAYRLSVPAFSDWRAWLGALKEAGLWTLLFLVPYLPLYHLWTTQVFGKQFGAGAIPPELGTLLLYQVFFVAIPEEFFYRGWMQTRLNELFERRFQIFGIPFSHSLWITSLFFAFGHSVVTFQWWHFAIFFPSLLFGLIRERTGSVLAGAFFHAACNVLVVVLDHWYGVVLPK
ncbi:MAG: type II CAAX endopeptidase family protein [Myxococcota bacterium]|nr:type II CAAX endopeptidase family protein [Myxococcota bacterium]